MKDAFAPVIKQSLSDRLARQIRAMIHRGDYARGDRLPTIMEMAKRWNVGHPTIREALKKLETMGVIDIRHGSGVYVSRSDDVLLMASQYYAGKVTKKLLADLIRTRIPLEVQSAAYAVRNATPEDILELRRLLTSAGQNLTNDLVLNETNMAFHRRIALASKNVVLPQLLDVLAELFRNEQRLILDIFGSRERDHREHVSILKAIEARDETLAVRRMKKHLEGVEAAILRWDADAHPVS